MSFLEILDATVRFGGLTALEKVSCAVEQGEIFAIVGPNGAGKSTLFNLISRFYEPDSGDIRLEGDSILGRTPSEIAALGIARSFQNIELFERSTVLQNLLIGRHTRRRASMLSQMFFAPSVRREEIAHRGRSSASSISSTFSPTGRRRSRAFHTRSARSLKSPGRWPWSRS